MAAINDFYRSNGKLHRSDQSSGDLKGWMNQFGTEEDLRAIKAWGNYDKNYWDSYKIPNRSVSATAPQQTAQPVAQPPVEAQAGEAAKSPFVWWNKENTPWRNIGAWGARIASVPLHVAGSFMTGAGNALTGKATEDQLREFRDAMKAQSDQLQRIIESQRNVNSNVPQTPTIYMFDPTTGMIVPVSASSLTTQQNN